MLLIKDLAKCARPFSVSKVLYHLAHVGLNFTLKYWPPIDVLSSVGLNTTFQSMLSDWVHGEEELRNTSMQLDDLASTYSMSVLLCPFAQLCCAQRAGSDTLRNCTSDSFWVSEKCKMFRIRQSKRSWYLLRNLNMVFLVSIACSCWSSKLSKTEFYLFGLLIQFAYKLKPPNCKKSKLKFKSYTQWMARQTTTLSLLPPNEPLK